VHEIQTFERTGQDTGPKGDAINTINPGDGDESSGRAGEVVAPQAVRVPRKP